MNINRNNYEEYFLLYVDNELSAEERKAVESFVSVNTDLRSELTLLQDAVFKPEKSISFDFKTSLLRNANPESVNETNCEEFFSLYADDELDNISKAEVEQFIYSHPQYQANFELLQQIKLEPDNKIILSDKSSLYRKEKNYKVVPFAVWRMMAAAVLFLIAGVSIWYLLSNDPKNAPLIVHAPVVQKQIENKKAVLQDTNPKTNPAVEKKSSNDQLLVSQPARIKSTRPNSTMVVTNTKQQIDVVKKINRTTGNILPTSIVPQKEEIIVKTEPVVKDVITDAVITRPAPNENSDVQNLATGTVEVYDTPVYTENSDKDIIYIANTSISKKNKLRGLVRQASRMFAKATSLEPVRNRGVRIASFEIGLK